MVMLYFHLCLLLLLFCETNVSAIFWPFRTRSSLPLFSCCTVAVACAVSWINKQTKSCGFNVSVCVFQCRLFRCTTFLARCHLLSEFAQCPWLTTTCQPVSALQPRLRSSRPSAAGSPGLHLPSLTAPTRLRIPRPARLQLLPLLPPLPGSR